MNRQMMNRIGRLLVPFAVAAMLVGCGVKESFKDAEVEVGKFHRALDAGDLRAIWRQADPALRQGAQRAELEKVLDAVHRKLGRVEQARQVGWNANATTDGSFVTLTYQTAFERGSGLEQFVYRKGDGGRIALTGYSIESQDMMLK
ncbi:DUF4019 domain-containing protein [Novosphingobium sp.]|jgi:hypothetical protein|uniref:DUF4019 domain-containing protein n=1 Tax=Novosphingobium sp. TaxID=1874826 RepID=UPI0028A981ED|nr:DUF4019 domain-containing protein [Novosphingobium sp.]